MRSPSLILTLSVSGSGGRWSNSLKRSRMVGGGKGLYNPLNDSGDVAFRKKFRFFFTSCTAGSSLSRRSTLGWWLRRW